MSILGPVTRIGGELVRPHDVEVFAEPHPEARAAVITRVTRLGFEVRVDLEIDGELAWAQVTRGTAQQFELGGGDRVYVRPARARISVNDNGTGGHVPPSSEPMHQTGPAEPAVHP
jgi:sulfate transport system ATP-binding protein